MTFLKTKDADIYQAIMSGKSLMQLYIDERKRADYYQELAKGVKKKEGWKVAVAFPPQSELPWQ